MKALLLAAVGGVGAFPVPGVASFPVDWNVDRDPSNPKITIFGLETHEQYTPAPIRLPNGDIWVYVKGAARIYAWKSTDDGATFAYQNGGGQVIGPSAGQWDGSFVVEPAALYDEDTDTIHVWYGARDANPDNWAIGHATAPGSDPTDFTKDPANPILTASDVEAALGAADVQDLKMSAPIIIGSTFHFYGYTLADDVYHLFHATGTTWNDPGSVESILAAATEGVDVVQSPSVVRMPGAGPAVYAMLWALGGFQPAPRSIRDAESSDGETWSFGSTDVLAPQGTGWEEDEVYCQAIMKTPDGLPVIVNGKWQLYYSGLEDDVAQAGIAYLDPS